MCVWVDGLDGAFVGVALYGGASADDADVSGVRGVCGELGCGGDDAKDGDVEGLSSGADGMGAGGIAGDDDGFDVSRDELSGA